MLSVMSFKKFLHLHFQIYWYEIYFFFTILSFCFVSRCIFICVFVCMSCVYRWEGVKSMELELQVAGCELIYVGVGTELESSSKSIKCS